MNQERATPSVDIRQQIKDAVEHLGHILPGQAAIKDFVHHNTLHGLQHLPFNEALKVAHETTGAYGYLPADDFRKYYQQGRINDDDLRAALHADDDLQAEDLCCKTDNVEIYRGDIFHTALIHPIKPVTLTQLHWQIDELNALASFCPDVSSGSRQRLLDSAAEGGITNETGAIDDLWRSCLESLGLTYYLLHPEDLLDLSNDQAKNLMTEGEGDDERPVVKRLMGQEASQQLQQLLDRVGEDLTLRGLLKTLTGEDLMDDMRPYLARHLSSWLDQGLAAWHHKDRAEGFFTAWRRSAHDNLAWIFDGLDEWRQQVDDMPEDSLEAIIEELKRLNLPRSRWVGYLKLIALELPGWSGMFYWRSRRPGYDGQNHSVDMMDLLAVRLVMERVFALRLIAHLWRIEPSIDMLRWHFRRNPAEFIVRYSLYNRRLPEYLISRAQSLIARDSDELISQEITGWTSLAKLIWSWQQSPAAESQPGYRVFCHAWRLFRLAQHLGLSGRDIRQLTPVQIEDIFACLDDLDEERFGFIWLQAYEHHYREELFNGVINNHARGRWATRESQPEAQLIFCMDDREEGTRRHLEELNPQVETFGAAAFYNLPINWRAMDADTAIALCPVVMTPTHEIREQARPGFENKAQLRGDRRRWRIRARNYLHNELRRNAFLTLLTGLVIAPVALASLFGKTFMPRLFGLRAAKLQRQFDLDVPTTLNVTAAVKEPEPSPENNQLGYTTEEQAERVGDFLQSIGLQTQLAPIVILLGHGSTSQNNPHLAAYNCGACSGRCSGSNARVFSAMVNRPEVRSLLRERGIEIPESTWFIGGEHNTGDETITWYDMDDIPSAMRPAFDHLAEQLHEACDLHAHERCRKFASAPKKLSPKKAREHVVARGLDFSQARPELGHATNAAAFVGRRSLSYGTFFDRRVFLVSYDPLQDSDGRILEKILLSVTPVGAGICLEYYFSTVNNERYGCGSKVTHNVAGFFGVMDGASSDLRTGLPRQMIEIHEAMRLQVVVEVSTEVLTEIYLRQPSLQELIGNGWLHLSAKDPSSGSISVFNPKRGWLPWEGEVKPLPTVSRSRDWYPETAEPVAPGLIQTGGKHA